MRVDIVALLYVLQNVGIVGRHSLLLQLVVAALGTYLCTGGDEDLEFGIGEDSGADIASIHHDATFESHLLLLGHKGCTHKGDGSDGADVTAHLEAAYLEFHILAIEECGGLAVDEALVDVDIRHYLAQLLLEYATVGCKELMAQGIEGDAAIHGACVNINIAHTTGKFLGHCAFAARRVAVYCYCNLFHVFFMGLMGLMGLMG